MRSDKSVLRARLLPGVALAFAVGLAAAGCDRAKRTGEVVGKVTYKGQPVSAGAAKFFPDDGSTPVETPLAPDGSYRATGVPVGRSKVAIETLRFKTMTPPPAGMAKQMGGPRPTYVPIPDKYEKPETSGLSVDVQSGRVVTLDVEIP